MRHLLDAKKLKINGYNVYHNDILVWHVREERSGDYPKLLGFILRGT